MRTGTREVFEWYENRSVATLQAVSRKYDPTGFFQRTVPGGFKISKVSENLSDGDGEKLDSIAPQSITS